MSDLGVILADANTAVIEANEKIIDELPACLEDLRAALDKMDAALKEWFTVTSHKFDMPSGIEIGYLGGSDQTFSGTENWKWSFDMCGTNVPYATHLGVDSSSPPTGNPNRKFRSVNDCWTHFNIEISNAAVVIRNAYDRITKEATIEAFQDLADLPPDRQNELISLAFEQNHTFSVFNYVIAATPRSGGQLAAGGRFSNTIAGQVWPSYDMADTSPTGLVGVQDDKYFLQHTYSSVDDDFVVSRADVDDEASFFVGEGNEGWANMHPSIIFNDYRANPDPGGPGSTAVLEGLSRVAHKRTIDYGSFVGTTRVTSVNREQQQTLIHGDADHYGATSITADDAWFYDGEGESIDTDAGAWDGDASNKLGIKHYCMGGENTDIPPNELILALLDLPDGFEMPSTADAVSNTSVTWNGVEYNPIALSYVGAKTSHFFKALYGDFTSLARPEILNWWLDTDIGSSGRVFNYKSSPLQVSTRVRRPSNLYALHGSAYSNGSRSFETSECENVRWTSWYLYAGSARYAISQERANEYSDIRDTVWSDGYVYGQNSPSSNLGVTFGAESGVPFVSSRDQSPIEVLQEKYNAVKEAFIGTTDSIRTASKCILQLDLNREEKRTVLNLTARSVLADEAASSTQRQEARDAINALAATADDFAAATRGFNSSLIFREQCFLMANLPTLARHSKNTSSEAGTRKSLPYGPYTDEGSQPEASSNASICVDASSPFAFMNTLSIGATDEAFFDMNSHDIASLQPSIQLYKIIFDEESKSEHSQRISFDQHADTSTILGSLGSTSSGTLLQNKQKRGFGVGIQSFNFKYAGSNPFAVKRSISATLKIFANGFDELLRERTSRILVDGEYQEKKYRYIDLALKTSNSGRASSTEDCSRQLINQENEEYAKLNFRLKAIVGWAYPEGETGHMTPGVKDSLYNAYTTLNLTPTVHDFEFDEQGRVVFTINYLAYVDDFFDQDDYNVFLSAEIYRAQEERRIRMQQFDCSSSEAQATARENAIPEIDREKTLSITNLISDLVSNNKIYYVQRSYDDIRNFVAAGPFFQTSDSETVVPLTSEDLNASLQSEIASALEGYSAANPSESMDAVRASLASVNPNSVNVPYFYLRDLCDIVLARVGNSLRAILYNMDSEASDTASSRIISEADDAAAAARDRAAAILAGSNPIEAMFTDYTPDTDSSYSSMSTLAPPASSLSLPPTAPEPVDLVDFYLIREPDLPDFPYYSDDDDLDSALGDDVATAVRVARNARAARDRLNDPEVLAAEAARRSRADASRALREATSDVDCRTLSEYLKILRLENEFQKFRLVLGPVELFDPQDDSTSYTVNFGDMPVSVKYFTEFLTEKLSSKEETVYPMANFFNDLMNGLVRNFLNDDTCFTSLNSSQRVTLNNASISGFNSGVTDEITDTIISMNGNNAPGRIDIDTVTRNPLINVSGNSRLPDAETVGLSNAEKNYMIFFAARTKPSPGQMIGNRTADHRSGIYHYELGRQKGIVKTIQLTKTETPGLQEVRFEQDGYDGLRQLRVVYDVNIETYANVHAYPGTYIFVNPRSFAPSSTLAPCHEFNLTEYGIGGYYMIITSEHRFAPGEASTKIYAKWVAEIGNDGSARNCSDSVAGGGRINRCGAGSS